MKKILALILGLSIIISVPQISYSAEENTTDGSTEKKPDGDKKKNDFEGLHTGTVNVVLFSPDGRTVISGSNDKNVMFWDPNKGKSLKKIFKGQSGAIVSMALTKDGKFLATGSNNHKIKIWAVSLSKQIRSLPGHYGTVNSVAFNSNGDFLVSASDDKKLKIWDLKKGKVKKTLLGHLGPVYSVAITPDDKYIISGSQDSTIKVWDFQTGNLLKTLNGHKYSVQSLALSPDGKHLASSSWREIKIWDTATWTIKYAITGNEVSGLTFNPKGNLLASGGGYYAKSIKIWNINTKKMVYEIAGSEGAVSTVAFSPDGETLVSGSDDWLVRFWDMETGKDKFSDN